MYAREHKKKWLCEDDCLEYIGLFGKYKEFDDLGEKLFEFAFN